MWRSIRRARLKEAATGASAWGERFRWAPLAAPTPAVSSATYPLTGDVRLVRPRSVGRAVWLMRDGAQLDKSTESVSGVAELRGASATSVTAGSVSSMRPMIVAADRRMSDLPALSRLQSPGWAMFSRGGLALKEVAAVSCRVIALVETCLWPERGNLRGRRMQA